MLEHGPEKHKAVTRFICQELLYEFVLGRLDPERQKAIDVYLSGDRESQHELERLRRGFVFAAQMSKSQMSGQLRASLLGFEPAWKRQLAQWTAWFSRRGWKLLPYLVLLGTLILGTIVTKPWTYFSQHEVVLVEEGKPPGTTEAPPADAKVQPSAKDTPLKAEEKESAAKVEAKPIIPDVISPSETKKAERPSLATVDIVEEAQPRSSPMPSPIAQAVDLPASGEPETTAAAAQEDAKTAEHFWLLRGTAEVNADFQIAVGAIRDKIVGLDGQVIGTIGLGVQRKKGEAYFHFSIPESKQADLEKFVKNFGPVRFDKQRDKRGMPEGQNHIILIVKDVSPREERKETETP